MGSKSPASAELWEQAKEIVADAIEFPSRAAQTAFVATACGDDHGLRREVESLLDQSTTGFDLCADVVVTPITLLEPGQRIGGYAVLHELGRGGMGAVFLAHRADGEFDRQVALKVLKRGTDTDEILNRFRSERRILARLDHPNIARLLDAGTTDDGLPYFVMEYVAGGETLTAFAHQHALSLTERLDLFRKVCAAVQFAHQNLVVHRDLKPGNILVTPAGDPKLLDFGIAKLLTPGEEAWKMTIAGAERLTPAYASPEQIRGEPITTASDVYSLGTLLYELLCERAPHIFSGDRPSATELSRTICETEPLRPSLAAARPETRRALRGDLETIILRAMTKAPARRYASVDQFSADILRYLEDLPVRARKDTLPYRASKFVRRNKLGVAIAASVMLTLVGGIIAANAQRQRAERLRVRAEKGEDINRKLLYAAQMSLAFRAWETANVGRAIDLLEVQRPASGSEDLRGFEWYLLWRLTHGRSRLLPGPTTGLNAAVFSRDGSKAAAASSDGKVFVWEVAQGNLLASFDVGYEGHEGIVFTPDGNFLVAGSTHGSAKLWAIQSGQFVREFTGHSKGIWALDLSPDGHTLATASLDGTAKLWNLETGAELLTLLGHTEGLTAIAFAPDGQSIVTASRDRTAKLWATATGKEIASFGGHTWWVLDVGFAPNGKTLATTGSDGDVRLWDVTQQRETGIIHGDGATKSTLAFSPDGNKLAIGDLENTIKIYRLANLELVDVLRGHTDFPTSVAYGADGRTLLSAGHDGTARLWNLTKQSGEQILEGHKDWVWDIAFSPGGQTLASASKDGTVKLWHVSTGRELMTLRHPMWVNGIRFSQDGSKLATVCDDTLVRLWNPFTGENLLTLRGHESIPESLAFSPDGSLLATGGKLGEIKIWDTATGQNIVTLRSPNNNLIWSVAFSPIGKYLAAGEGGVGNKMGHLITIWDTSSWHLLRTLEGHAQEVRCVAFSPDGKLLVSGSIDGSIKFWDTSNFKELVTLRTSQIQALAFSVDGKRLASAGLDKTIELWDVATRQELCTLSTPSLVNTVAFSPTSSVFAAGGTDNLIRTWSVDPGEDKDSQSARTIPSPPTK